MINRMTRILTRWLATHPVYGLPALLASVSFDSEAEGTALLLRTNQLPLTIYNDVDDECTAARYDPDSVPALVIVAQMSMEGAVRRARGQEDYDDVAVTFAYMERDEPINYARQRGGYVLTAVADSLNAFNEPMLSRVPIPQAMDDKWAATSPSWRALGSVEILELTALREARVTGGVGTSKLIGATLALFKVRRSTQARYSVSSL